MGESVCTTLKSTWRLGSSGVLRNREDLVSRVISWGEWDQFAGFESACNNTQQQPDHILLLKKTHLFRQYALESPASRQQSQTFQRAAAGTIFSECVLLLFWREHITFSCKVQLELESINSTFAMQKIPMPALVVVVVCMMPLPVVRTHQVLF